MSSLSRDLRNQLSRVTLLARAAAEGACAAALENLAVHEKDYRGHMSVEQRQLRNRLRARGRALGDTLDERSGKQEIKHLSEDAAYEHWHRLLFTRFLAENGLLHTDAENDNVPVTLEDCEELALELGAKDGFDLACRFANQTLPGVFRSGDPVFELTLALNDQVALRQLLDSLPSEVFTADDSLGWTYQFWQAQRKDEVNASGKKIGSDEISPVTQLFTEDYMVEFLLHNTLGAWWAGKLGPIHAGSEEEARSKAALSSHNGLSGIAWTYLRFIQDEKTKTWSPGAGTFDGWPKQAAEITFLDPCMGSGHFPVFALPILARLRMEEEKISARQAIHAVLRDNIHGLELDQRCTQIGAFNLALSAWKLAGYQTLPSLHIACCGIAPQAKKEEWLKLAGESGNLHRGMERLYKLFEQAPILGSLINPRAGAGDLLESEFHELQPLLEKALAQEAKDDTAHEMAVTARGLAKAAEILAGQFTLVATNVPYLGLGKQDELLRSHCAAVFPNAKADLATCFVERCFAFCKNGGSTALVTPQSWLFLGTYKKLRESLLGESTFNAVAKLGPGAFETISGEVVNAALIEISKVRANDDSRFLGVDVSEEKSAPAKAQQLGLAPVMFPKQGEQIQNADARIVLSETSAGSLLLELANSYEGIGCGDLERFSRVFTEVPSWGRDWRAFRGTTKKAGSYAGAESIIYWQDGKSDIYELAELLRDRLKNTWQRGCQAWGKRGLAVNRMGDLLAEIYEGEIFDSNIAAIIPKAKNQILPIWLFVSSDQFREEIRRIDQSMKITNMTFLKVPFDLDHWQKVADERYPNGLPTPHSDDPTQWLFNGHPKDSDQPLHATVARLCGYQWPRQTGSSFPDCPALGPDGLESFADEDGIICIPALNREQPAATRLRALLAAALGSFDEKKLLAATGAKASTLEDWLRDECFEQHSKLFHHRPFLWHIWDGRKDGFSVLVNYHRLDHATLQKLTYTYLGNWIHDQESDAKADKPGAAERLSAAQALQAELVKILEGEAPYDLFVRWKPLKDQAIGWHPDLNDGVRLNIRPFLVARDMGKKGAGLLRAKPNIKWDKDRGKEPERPKSDYPWFWCESEPGTDPTGGKTFTGHRWNDVHLTLAFKKGGNV